MILGVALPGRGAAATEVALNAYWNSSYFGGRYDDIRRAKLW
jgi:hypothetical protein